MLRHDQSPCGELASPGNALMGEEPTGGIDVLADCLVAIEGE